MNENNLFNNRIKCRIEHKLCDDESHHDNLARRFDQKLSFLA